MTQTAEQPDTILRRMGSLADASRVRVLRLLEQHELGVAELCDVLQMPQSTVSRHLKLLGREGWVRWRREGTTNFYRMILDELDEPARRLWLLTRNHTDDWTTLGQDRARLAQILRARQSDAQAFFADAAEAWDRTRAEAYGMTFGRDAMLGLLPRGWTVADLGCGTGAQTAELARFVGRVIAVDNSEAMLESAAQRTAGLSNVDIRRGHLESLPIEDGACDAAMLVLVLPYLSEPMAVLNEAARILDTGGRAVVVDLLRHDRDEFRRRMSQRNVGFEPKDLRDMLEAAGFDEVTCRPLPPEPKAKGPALQIATAGKRGTKGSTDQGSESG